MSNIGVKFTDLPTLDSNRLSLSAIIPVVQDEKNFVTTVGVIADHFDSTLIETTSGNWDSTYTTVSANSAEWFNGGTGGTIQGTGINTLNIRATDEGLAAGLTRGEGSVDLQTSRETETQVASGANSVIAGGKNNQATGAQDAIGGGASNSILDPMGFNNVIGGGSNNYIIGYANAIPGGTNNSIRANKSFAAGSNASALHDGAFVFSDSTTTDTFSSVQANSVNFRALGGLRLIDGNEAVGKVLTCTDTEGTGHWALPDEVENYDHTLLESTSGSWDSTYTTVSSNSAIWDAHTDPYDDSLLQSTSGSWDSTYTTVSANSASWAGGDTTVQYLSVLGAHAAPNPLVIDLTQGLNVEGWLTANVSLQLSGAEAGQSGLITLGNGRDHDGVGFTVDFHLDNTTNLNHTAGGHSIMTGDLADFATAPGAGEFNFGTIGWYYTGNEYLLYVSEVKPYTTSIQPAPVVVTDYCLNGSQTFSQAGVYNGEAYYNAGVSTTVLFWTGLSWEISDWITEGVDTLIPGAYFGGSDPTDPTNGPWFELTGDPATLTAGVCP